MITLEDKIKFAFSLQGAVQRFPIIITRTMTSLNGEVIQVIDILSKSNHNIYGSLVIKTITKDSIVELITFSVLKGKGKEKVVLDYQDYHSLARTKNLTVAFKIIHLVCKDLQALEQKDATSTS